MYKKLQIKKQFWIWLAEISPSVIKQKMAARIWSFYLRFFTSFPSEKSDHSIWGSICHWSTREHVDTWTCEHVDTWTREHVDMWTCGHVNMWTCGHVNMWTCGQQQLGMESCHLLLNNLLYFHRRLLPLTLQSKTQIFFFSLKIQSRMRF